MEERIKKLLNEIKAQIDHVKDEDSFLFSKPRVYESSISHRLAIYLATVFPKHDIDVEYDKYGDNQRKELDCFRDFCTQNSTDRIRPDIIVHHRGITNSNLLVMEIKDAKAPNSAIDCVNEKLIRLTNRDGSFGYLLGVLWLFGEEDKENIYFYVNGKKYDSKLYQDVIALLDILKNYEVVSNQGYDKYKSELKVFQKECHEIDLKIEENERKEADEKMVMEIAERDCNFVTPAFENPRDEEENRLYNMSSKERYLETGICDDVEEDDENDFSKPFEQINDDGDSNNYSGPDEEPTDFESLAINNYKNGLINDRKFDCFLMRNDLTQPAKTFSSAWSNLNTVATNSLLFDYFYCFRKEKELIARALEYNDKLNIFQGDEIESARNHLKLLIGFIGFKNIKK